jgi:hypothetical protein
MYVSEREAWELLQRLTDRFGSGELLFDTLSPIAPRLSLLLSGGIVKWGIRDAREIETWNPRLRFLEQASALAGYEKIPHKPQRRSAGTTCSTASCSELLGRRRVRFAGQRADVDAQR